MPVMYFPVTGMAAGDVAERDVGETLPAAEPERAVGSFVTATVIALPVVGNAGMSAFTVIETL